VLVLLLGCSWQQLRQRRSRNSSSSKRLLLQRLRSRLLATRQLLVWQQQVFLQRWLAGRLVAAGLEVVHWLSHPGL
jgi:hypothetical protein